MRLEASINIDLGPVSQPCPSPGHRQRTEIRDLAEHRSRVLPCSTVNNMNQLQSISGALSVCALRADLEYGWFSVFGLVQALTICDPGSGLIDS